MTSTGEFAFDVFLSTATRKRVSVHKPLQRERKSNGASIDDSRRNVAKYPLHEFDDLFAVPFIALHDEILKYMRECDCVSESE